MPARAGHNLARTHPALWEAITDLKPGGTLSGKIGEFTFVATKFGMHGSVFDQSPLSMRGSPLPGALYFVSALTEKEFLAPATFQRHVLKTTFLAMGVLLTCITFLLVFGAARRRSYEAELRAGDQRLREVFAGSPDAIVVSNAAGLIVDTNTRSTALTGYEREELLGASIEMLVPEHARDAHPQSRREYLEAPGQRTMGCGRQLSIRCRDGSTIPVEIGLSTIESRGQRLVISAVRDMRDIAIARRALEDSEKLTRIAVTSAGLGIFDYDLDTGALTWNDEMHRIHGTTPGAFSGTAEDWIARIHPDDAAKGSETLGRAMRGGSMAFEFRIRRADGAERWVSILENFVTAPRHDRGQPTRRLVGTCRDITETKERIQEIEAARTAAEQSARQLVTLNAELESFAYSVSHDLRTPLRAMSGFSEILLRDYAGGLDARAQDFLDRIIHASVHMGSLIEDLLRLSRVRTGEMKIEDIDISALAAIVMTELSSTAPERKLKLRIEPGLSARGDSALVRVVLENLLGNAWKFSSRTAEAEIRVGGIKESGRRWFFVEDNGIGFDPAYAGKLFEPFQRLHSDPEFPGSGIGLATVRRIVERHCGEVRAEAQPGKGATFYFTLELPRAPRS